jgi:hypothetical protein
VAITVLPVVRLGPVRDHEARRTRALQLARHLEDIWPPDVETHGQSLAARPDGGERPVEVHGLDHDPAGAGGQRRRQGRVVVHPAGVLQVRPAAHDVVMVRRSAVDRVLVDHVDPRRALVHPPGDRLGGSARAG